MIGISRRAAALGMGGALMAGPARTAGVDDNGFLPIGGIDQWISVRGASTDAPILLFLHGGPGDAQSPFLSLFGPWEREFRVAQWDQRGAGRTFGRNGQATPDVTLDRIVADGLEVARHLRTRYRRRKIILAGHSWGSLVGVRMIKQDPEPFAAFVGCGQFVTWMQALGGQYAYVLTKAEATGNAAAMAELKALQPLKPADFSQIGLISKWLRQYQPASDAAYLETQTRLLADPAYPAAEWRAGGQFSIPRLYGALTAGDLPTLGLDMPIPVFVIQGRDDPRTATPAAEAWLKSLKAPRKGFATIDGGHFAPFTHAEPFIVEVNRQLAPLRRDLMA